MNGFKSFTLITGMTAVLVAFGFIWRGETGVVLALGVGLLMNAVGYFFSDSIVLAMYRARVVAQGEAPDLHAIIANLAQRAGLPMPRIAIIPDETPNAFATGRNPDHAVVAVTEGILRVLNRAELEGVIAHELGHVKHRDILLGSLAAVLAQAIIFISHMALWITPRDEEGRSNPIAGILMYILGPIAAMMLQMALSRSREYMADEYSAHLTGRPDMLASALQRLAGYNAQVPMRDAQPATAHMMIVNPLSGEGIASLITRRLLRLALRAAASRRWPFAPAPASVPISP